MPESHGGLGADLAGDAAVLEALARADASTGWTVMIGGNAWIDLAGLPRADFDELFDRPDVIVAGVFAPSGSIDAGRRRVPGDGPLGFASGCEHADVLYGNCVEATDGEPRMRTVLRAGRRADRGHLDGGGAVRHGQPPLPRGGRGWCPPTARYRLVRRPAVPGRADRAHPAAHADLAC